MNYLNNVWAQCFTYRSGVLAIGLVGSTMAVSGLMAYAIVQVPTLRTHLGEFLTHRGSESDQMEEEYNLSRVAYRSVFDRPVD